MEPEQRKEFDELERLACVSLVTGRWALCLKALPAFGNPMIIGVLEGQPRIITWRHWHKAHDLHAFSTPVERLRHKIPYRPTIQERSSPIDIAQFEAMLQPLCKLHIPAYVQNSHIGLDGFSYEITMSDHTTSSCFRWWGTGPAAWRPLMDLYTQTWAWLLNLLDLDPVVTTPDMVWN